MQPPNSPSTCRQSSQSRSALNRTYLFSLPPSNSEKMDRLPGNMRRKLGGGASDQVPPEPQLHKNARFLPAVELLLVRPFCWYWCCYGRCWNAIWRVIAGSLPSSRNRQAHCRSSGIWVGRASSQCRKSCELVGKLSRHSTS